MKYRKNAIRFGVSLLIVLFMIFILPYLVFLFQDRKIINRVKQMDFTPVTVTSISNESKMKISDKLALIDAEVKEIEQVNLKMGEIFSLYEARKQCFKELCKIPVLEMDLYGPVKEEINIEPKLFINTRTPSYTMIAWIGSVTIKDITYRLALDEQSKKLILLEIKEDDKEVKSEVQEQFEKEWMDYLQL